MAMSRPDRSPIHTHNCSPARAGPYSQDIGGDQLRINAFDHGDVDVAFDPLSTNRRFPAIADLAVSLVFGGPTLESIDVMIPDCLLPPLGEDVRIGHRHLVTLSLGQAVDMGDSMPPPNLDRDLCPNSLAPTLGLQRREYWDENVNDARCPECDRLIRVNIARHLRLVHLEYVCFWRCPVPSCSLWFTSELNAKDHIENIHRFREGRGMSFYECLRAFGLEWFGSRSFFDGSGTTTSSQRARSSPHYAGSSPPPSINSRLSTIPCWSLLHSLRPAHSSRRCVLPSKIVTISHLREASC